MAGEADQRSAVVAFARRTLRTRHDTVPPSLYFLPSPLPLPPLKHDDYTLRGVVLPPSFSARERDTDELPPPPPVYSEKAERHVLVNHTSD